MFDTDELIQDALYRSCLEWLEICRHGVFGPKKDFLTSTIISMWYARWKTMPSDFPNLKDFATPEQWRNKRVNDEQFIQFVSKLCEYIEIEKKRSRVGR